MTALDPDILDALPHRAPFRFLTEVLSLNAGTSGEAVWRVTGSEPFFEGHFPGHPIVPGVLLCEALAQLSGLVAFGISSEGQSDAATPAGQPAKLAHVDFRFRDAVVPPADVILKSKLSGRLGPLLQFEVEAVVNERRVTRGRLGLAVPKTSDPA